MGHFTLLLSPHYKFSTNLLGHVADLVRFLTWDPLLIWNTDLDIHDSKKSWENLDSKGWQCCFSLAVVLINHKYVSTTTVTACNISRVEKLESLTEKLERTNARALRFVYSNKISTYEALLGRIGSTSTVENHRTQDMLLTVNNITQGRAPSSFKNLITEKRTTYNLRGNSNLSIPKVNTTRYGL